MDDTERDFLYRETRYFKRYDTSVPKKIAEVIRLMADSLKAQACRDHELAGYAYKLPFVITVGAVYFEKYDVKITAMASAKGTVLKDLPVSIPILEEKEGTGYRTTEGIFLSRESRCFRAYNANLSIKIAEALRYLADGIEAQICYYPGCTLKDGYAYELPLTVTVWAMVDWPSMKIEVEASAKGTVLSDIGVSVPILKREESKCDESQ